LTNGPSKTAIYVAFLRALATSGITEVRDFSDPLAARLLPFPVSVVHRVLHGLARILPPFRRFVWTSMAGLVDLVALRTLAIDEAFNEAHARGIRQLVILGAGLDARAYRWNAVDDVRVFEVDHPQTQAFKRRRIASAVRRVRSIEYVALDFTSENLESALESARHACDQPSFWIVEGVTIYLEPAESARMLTAVFHRSAPASMLAVSYLPPQPGGLGWAKRVARSWGEPLVGLMTGDEVAAMVRGTGFEIVADSGTPDWAKRFSDRAPLRLDRFSERLMVAERRKQESGSRPERVDA
jgi:methyltransferase (TIGR00027 family)